MRHLFQAKERDIKFFLEFLFKNRIKGEFSLWQLVEPFQEKS